MNRRDLLRTGVGAGIGIGLGASAAAARDGTGVTQDAYEPLGSVSLDGAAEAVVGDDGETAYVATIDGFATVDVSDPEAPAVLAERRDLVDEAQFTQILDVKVDGDLLVVAGPGNQVGSQVFYGFVLYDVSDPADPVRVGDPFETGYFIHNCYLDGEVLYLCNNTDQGNPLVAYDVSDGDPEELGRWSLLDHEAGWADIAPSVWQLHDVYVQDDVAYAPYWNAGTYLLDVSDPSDPTYLSHVAITTLEEQREVDQSDRGAVGEAVQALPGNDHYAAVDETGDLLAVGREAWAVDPDDTEAAGGVDLFDASDPSDPTHLSRIEAPESYNATYNGGQWTTSHNFELRDGRLYTSWYQGGVKIHDISDPSNPEELAWWSEPQEAGFWTARVAAPGETFVASSTGIIPQAGTESGLYVFPDRAGEQADPPTLSEPPRNAAPSDDGDDGTSADGNGTGTTASATDPNDDGSNESTETDTGTDEDDSIPGFTATAGVAGGALALEWARRRARDPEE